MSFAKFFDLFKISKMTILIMIVQSQQNKYFNYDLFKVSCA